MTMHPDDPPSCLSLAALIVMALPGVFSRAGHAGARAPRGQPSTAPAADAQLATVKQYCAGCHNDRAKMAGVSFDGLTAQSIAQNPDLFEKAVRKLRGRVMPPPGAKQPEPAAVDSLVTWLETSLDRAASPAYLRDKTGLHRLNRKEYANAVRDLLNVEIDAAELLPADDVADGFDNIATALQVSPSFIEQYVIAARSVAVKAIGRADARPGGWTFRAGPGHAADARGRPAARHPRRHPRQRGSAVGRRIRRGHRRHRDQHLGQRDGVREPAGRDPRR